MPVIHHAAEARPFIAQPGELALQRIEEGKLAYGEASRFRFEVPGLDFPVVDVAVRSSENGGRTSFFAYGPIVHDDPEKFGGHSTSVADNSTRIELTHDADLGQDQIESVVRNIATTLFNLSGQVQYLPLERGDLIQLPKSKYRLSTALKAGVSAAAIIGAAKLTQQATTKLKGI